MLTLRKTAEFSNKKWYFS